MSNTMSKRNIKDLVADACRMAKCKVEDLIFKARRWRYGNRRGQRQIAVSEANAFKKFGTLAEYVVSFITGGHYRTQTA